MNRREFLAVPPLAVAAMANPALAQGPDRLQRTVPRSGERVPAIGMGTWLTFDVGGDPGVRAVRGRVLADFFAAGGGMIDSSPMYGHAEQVVGELLPGLPYHGRLFAATKVWTPFAALGQGQIDASHRLWGLPRLDLLLVHNLLNWPAHMKTLRAWKDAGRVRYIGVSTSHGRKHEEMLRVIEREPIDFIQITYNPVDVRAEPVMRRAAERGIAVVINRPFDGGALFYRVRGQALPAWAAEIDCANWAQFFLKWIVAHPTVTCAIPATRQPAHMVENMSAGAGRLPDAAMRRRMLAYFEAA
jgi:diketogulonate reductase-like aldo/keto reductase